MKEATDIFKKHWVKATGKPLDEATKSHMKYAIEAVDEALNKKPINDKLSFGDYCTIEQNRFGCDNEHYIHKVITTLRSNTWVDVPVMKKATETLHDHMEDVVSCICCGVRETEVLQYKVSDVKKVNK